MHRHLSLREHLVERAERGHPAVFQPSNDRPLVEFAAIFAAAGLDSLDANKRLPEDELSPLYILTVESVRVAGAEPVVFTRHWAPVQPGRDPLTGFHSGPDSATWGSSPSEVMPQDEWTAALLLLVTTNYVHLSATREQSPPLVRGAIDERGEQFRYVVLAEPDPGTITV